MVVFFHAPEEKKMALRTVSQRAGGRAGGQRVTAQHQSVGHSALGGEGKGRGAQRVCERQLVCGGWGRGVGRGQAIPVASLPE